MPTPNLLAILDKIIGALRENVLPAGVELTEGEIAKKLALSRSTVRLAISIIAKAQQQCPALTYRPPRGAQRSQVIFAKVGKSNKPEGIVHSDGNLTQRELRESPSITAESTILCSRCKTRRPFKEIWQLYTSGAVVACEGCGLDLRKVIERWNESNDDCQ